MVAGGVALIRVASKLADLRGRSGEGRTWSSELCALRAMEAPLRQIVLNCGEEPSCIITNTVKSGDGNYGYNAATGKCGNHDRYGVPGSSQSNPFCLQYAASVAGLMITTECMVTRPAEKRCSGDCQRLLAVWAAWVAWAA